ncbi:MAG: bifunctional nuclease domain-containing protein [Acidobacteriota bacterium]
MRQTRASWRHLLRRLGGALRPDRLRRVAGVVALLSAVGSVSARAELVEVKLAGLDPRDVDQVVLILIDEPGKRMLPISVSPGQAQSIYRGRAGIQPPRPMTHELMLAGLEVLGGRITRIDITELHNNTYYAELFLEDSQGKTHKIDSRPSDAIALALRADAPIFASRGLMLPLEGDSRPDVESHPVLSSLGLHLQALTEELARFFDAAGRQGVLVAESASGSPSSDSGVRRGDIIQRIGKRPIRTVTEALSALQQARKEGQSVEVLVVRGGRDHSVKLEW